MDKSCMKGKLDIGIRYPHTHLFHRVEPQTLGEGPKEVVRFPSLEILKTQLDRAQHSQVYIGPAFRGGWSRDL